MKIYLLFFSLLIFTSTIFSQTDKMEPIRGICIYIDYPDVPAKVGYEQLDSLLNGIDYQEPGVRRSMRKYWRQESRRNIDMTHDIFFYTADKPATHYAGLTWQEGIDLWRVAMESLLIDYPNYDWSQLSKHRNGGLREVMVISSSNIPAGVGGAHWPLYYLPNGVLVTSTHGSWIQYPGQTTNNLFVIAHEAGHSAFGLPDTYDYTAESKGTGGYSLMSGQGPDIPPLGGPFLEDLKWGNIIQIEEEGEHTITLEADGDDIFVYHNPHNQAEVFTIEARKNTTPGNSLFPAPLGLLVWHSDNNVTTSNTLNDMTEEKHYMHSIEQADGFFQMEQSGGPPTEQGDLYLPGRTFTDATTPNSKWWNGESSGFELKDIKFIGTDKIEFTVTIPSLHGTHYDKIPKEDWLATGASPSQEGHGPEKAFDDDLNTFYHVPWGNDESRPHEIDIYLGDEYLVSEAYYQANDNFAPPFEGRVEDYFVSFSTDGINYEVAAAGALLRSKYEQFIEIEEPVLASYVRFSALTSFDNDSRTSVAEFSLRGISADLVAQDDLKVVDFLELYPNPVRDILNVETEGTFTELHIFDMNGQVVLGRKIGKHATIDIGQLPKGVYTVLAKSDNKLDRKKFIKI